MHGQGTPFDDDLGTYVGPASIEEAIRALDEHTPGEWVMRLTDPDGKTLWHKTGWSWYLTENEEEAMFAVNLTEQGAGNPSLAVDAPIVLAFSKRVKLHAEPSLYTGGLSFRFAFGDYAGHTLALIAWHSVLHVTETGDVAPGFGEFVGEVRPTEREPSECTTCRGSGRVPVPEDAGFSPDAETVCPTCHGTGRAA